MRLTIQAKALLLSALILVADQAIKIWIKTHWVLLEKICILGDKACLYFTENPGMAFGLELDFLGSAGKLLLTLFRVAFIGALVWFTCKQIRSKAATGVVLGLAAMCTGALGNLIDCLFYGVMFTESTFTQVAQLFPAGGGYASLGFGKVVDMIHLPVINTTLPSWVPLKGGEQFVFFSPIFNVADAAITCSVFYLLLFQRTAFLDKTKNHE